MRTKLKFEVEVTVNHRKDEFVSPRSTKDIKRALKEAVRENCVEVFTDDGFESYIFVNAPKVTQVFADDPGLGFDWGTVKPQAYKPTYAKQLPF